MANQDPSKQMNSAIESLEDATKRMEYYVSNRHKESKAEMAWKRHEDRVRAVQLIGLKIAQASRDKRKLEQAAKMKKQAAADKRWKAGAEQRAKFAKHEAEAQLRDKEKFAKEWWYNNAGLGSQERASEKWDSVINSRDKDRFINGGGSELEWPMHAAKKSASERKGRRMRENKITKTQLAQIIKEEYQRTLNEDDDWDAGYDARDERGDPDNWDHSYDDNNSYEGGNLTDDEVSEFAEAYGAVEQLRRIKPTALPESVSDAILDMLNKLGIYL